VTSPGSTIPLPIVVATWVETKAPTKLSPPPSGSRSGSTTHAWRCTRDGVRRVVEAVDEVEGEGREDHEPSSSSGASGILERHALEDVGGVLAPVGGRFQRLVDLFPLEDEDGVLLVLEEVRDRVRQTRSASFSREFTSTQCS